LPPQSLRVKEKEKSQEDALRRFPSELGRSNSISQSVKQVEKRSPILNLRTTSLPGTATISPVIKQRNMSTPQSGTEVMAAALVPLPKSPPTLNQEVETLPSPPTEKLATLMLEKISSPVNEPLASPVVDIQASPMTGSLAPPVHDSADFSPNTDIDGEGDADREGTVRGKNLSIPVIGSTPLVPSSVRLVGAPQFETKSLLDPDPLHRTAFRASSPWGRQTPHSTPSGTPSGLSTHRLEDPPVVPTLPEGEEDDEEKGRRLACEFLEGDYTNVPADKQAMFLGGP
jgi:hypothetical protein